ncbi:MAG: thiamine diphosphokinase [Bacteroidales bacterium]|nr:thiamine diphosphokinase [Bacteroidales bacterium]
MPDLAVIPFIHPYKTVILANGDFPEHPEALFFLREAEQLICCDGATESLVDFGLEPHYIIGDLDSLSKETRIRYQHCLYPDPDQETNDLTKAVQFCRDHQWTDITILGATGKREDHTLANISLLTEYIKTTNVQMITNHGVFVPFTRTSVFETYAGQQVSVFTLKTDTVFTFHGLKYPLVRKKLLSWWQGSLNEALGEEFMVEIEGEGTALLFREHRR